MESPESLDMSTSKDEPVSPLESPFKLVKVKGNKEGLTPLNLQPKSNANHSLSPVAGNSTISSTSPTMPSTKLISLNPFSLSKFSKTPAPNINGSCTSRISPSSGLAGSGRDSNSEQLITDLQNEVAALKKEIESKDAKLTSSMRSIKMFWSPELKKERAGRKEDLERLLMLKSQYDLLNADIKKKVTRIEELESEIRIEKEGRNAVTERQPELQITNTASDEIEILLKKIKHLEDQLYVIEGKAHDADNKINMQELQLSEKESLVKSLETQIEDLQSERNRELHQEVDCQQTETSFSDNRLETAQQQILSFYQNLKVLIDWKADDEMLSEESDVLQQCEKKIQGIMQEKSSLEERCHCEQEKRGQLDKKLKEINEGFELLKQQAKDLESELKIGREQQISLEKDLADSKRENERILKDFHNLQQQSGNKEQEFVSIQEELCKMKMTLDEKENIITEKEQTISSLSLSRKREIVETDDLKGIIDAKNREIESLNKKYETLDTYLSHRETALSHARDELNEIKSKHACCTSTINFMETQIADKDQLISRLEKQRNRLEKEKEDEVTTVNNSKEQVDTRIEILNKQIEEKNEIVKDLESKITNLETKVNDLEKEHKSATKSLLEEQENKIKEIQDELNKSQSINKKLEKELAMKKSSESLDKGLLKATEDSHKRLSGTSPVKDSKMIKQLWDEIAKKDNRLQDLEKQLKEKSKQLSNMRKNQNLDKQTQLYAERNKTDEESHKKVSDLQEDLAKKEDRITMLEDALRESVSIAAEREELLAQHVELSESASQTIRELEAEVDRVTMEKGITNIKNAFLILSLGERDAVVASLKAMRKRNTEELMNIKQTALLAAISEKDANIALLELQSSSKGRKQEIKQLKLEKDKLVHELKEQTQQRIIITNNEDNKEGLLYKELEDAPTELALQALRNLQDSSDKLEYYIDALLSFVKERDLEILKELPSLQRRSPRGIDTLRNAGKSQLLREMQKLENDCSELKSFVDILLEKLEG